MKVSRGVKPGVEDLAVDRYRCQVSVEVQKHQTQEMRLNRSTRCQEAVERSETFSIDLEGIEVLSSCDKKKLRKLDR